jgi:hypothetical protein
MRIRGYLATCERQRDFSLRRPTRSQERTRKKERLPAPFEMTVWRSETKRRSKINVTMKVGGPTPRPREATRGGSLCGKEAEDFAHDAVGLVCLEEILGVGGAFENDEGFWLGSSVVLLLNAGETWAVTAGVVARDDK